MIKVRNENGEYLEVQYSTFPAGEQYIRVIDTDRVTKRMRVELNSAKSEAIMKALLFPDTLKLLGAEEVHLSAEYLPYSRQDRACKEGESPSLSTFEQLLKTLYTSVETIDLHNPAAVDESFILNNQVNYNEYIEYSPELVIIAPDAGAANRCQLASQGRVPVAVLNKTRTNAGISQEPRSTEDTDLIQQASRLLIVDDICDGGATFLSAAKVLRSINPTAELHLLVTHGIFSQGLDKLNEVFTTVKCINPYYKEFVCQR